MKAQIKGSALTVGALEPGTLFSVDENLSRRLFVKCGDGLSTASVYDGRDGGKKIAGRNATQPPVFAIIVPTIGVHDDRFDRRAFTPASQRLAADTPVEKTYGMLFVGA